MTSAFFMDIRYYEKYRNVNVSGVRCFALAHGRFSSAAPNGIGVTGDYGITWSKVTGLAGPLSETLPPRADTSVSGIESRRSKAIFP